MKKSLILITAFITASAAFGQNAKSTGITKTDVQSWIKNQKQIEQSLNEAGISRDNIADAGKQEKAKAESILQKYGITAPNSIEKYAMINQCATLVLAENGAGSGIDPNTMAMLKKMNVDPFAELRANTNQKDCKVVKANEKAIVNLMKEMDQTNAGRANETQESAQDDVAQFKELNEKRPKSKTPSTNFPRAKATADSFTKTPTKQPKHTPRKNRPVGKA